MFNVTIEGNLEKLSLLSTKLENIPQEVFKSIGDLLIEQEKRIFAEGGLPNKWKPLVTGAPSHLNKTGALLNSFHISDMGNNFVEVSTASKSEIPYVMIHQYGGVIRAKNKPYLKFKIGNRWVQKKEVTIPARKYVLILEETKTQIIEMLNEYITIS